MPAWWDAGARLFCSIRTTGHLCSRSPALAWNRSQENPECSCHRPLTASNYHDLTVSGSPMPLPSPMGCSEGTAAPLPPPPPSAGPGVGSRQTNTSNAPLSMARDMTHSVCVAGKGEGGETASACPEYPTNPPGQTSRPGRLSGETVGCDHIAHDRAVRSRPASRPWC